MRAVRIVQQRPNQAFVRHILPVCIPVQNIMLDNEDHIEKDGDVPQQKLDWVSRDATPVTLETRVQHHLHKRQQATRQVQQDLNNTPANRRLPLVIQPRLRHILDHRNHQLDIRKCINLEHGSSVPR